MRAPSSVEKAVPHILDAQPGRCRNAKRPGRASRLCDRNMKMSCRILSARGRQHSNLVRLCGFQMQRENLFVSSVHHGFTPTGLDDNGTC
jgi:hypothetical protein